MKSRSLLMVSVLVLTLALAACSAQATPTATPQPVNTQAAPADTMVPATAMPADTMAAATAPATSGSGNAVTISNYSFGPATLTVKVGTTVKWTNQDTVAHTVTSDSGVFDSGNLPQGQSFSYTFATAGTYPYHCTYHAMMTGTVVVTN
jgi:plastocyanin